MDQSINNKKCIVVIPVYLDKLPYDDEMCVKTYVDILTNKDIVFIAPDKLDETWYREKFPGVNIVRFKDKYFTGTKSYNHLMLDIKFYERFLEYDYMLVAQTDACIWGSTDRIDEFIKLGYDYIGAPWIPERRIWEWILEKKDGRTRIRCCKKENQGITMGNGGFSLRNIRKTIALIKEFGWRKCYWFFKRNEDIFFGLFGISNKCGYKLADVTTGRQFSAEYNLRDIVQENMVPFAVHGWKKDFENFDAMRDFLRGNGIWQ